MKKLLLFSVGLFLVGQYAWAVNEQTRFFIKLGDEKKELSRNEIEGSVALRRVVAKRSEEFFDQERNEFVVDLEREDLFEGLEEIPVVKFPWEDSTFRLILQDEKEARERKRERKRLKKHFKKKAEEWRAERGKKEVSKRPKIEVEQKRFKKEKARLENFKDTKFFLKLGKARQKIKRTGFDLSKWFNDAFDEYSEDKKYFDEQENEFTLDLDEPLSHLKWKKDFESDQLKVFIELCDNSDDQLKETLRSIKQEDLIPLILFADYFEVTSSPERGHSPERDILLLLLQELASRITDKDFFDWQDGKKALLWKIINKLPDYVLEMLKDFAFPDERGKDPIELKGHEGGIKDAIWLPCGRMATVSLHGAVCIWNVKSRSLEAYKKVKRFSPSKLLLLANGNFAVNFGLYDIFIWDTKKNRFNSKLVGHTDAIPFLLLLPDGKIASGSDDKTICIWDLKKEKSAKKKPIAVLKGHSGVVTFLLSLSGDRIASGSRDGEIRIWNLKEKTSFVLQGHTDRITSLVLLDNDRIASGSWDGTIRIWNLKEKTSFVLKWCPSRIISLILLRDGRIASGLKDGTICICNPNEKEADQVLTGHKKKIDLLFLLPDDRIASISQDKTIRIWDLNDGGSSVIFKEDASGLAHFLLLLPDGRLAGASTSGTILIWNVFDIFKNLTFKQAALARLLQLNSMEPEKKKRPIFRKRKMRTIFSSLPKDSQQLFFRLGWLVQ